MKEKFQKESKPNEYRQQKLAEILEYHLGYNSSRHNIIDIDNELEKLYETNPPLNYN